MFFTTTVLDFVPVFKNESFASQMLQIIENVHVMNECKLHSYVVMPEHLHFLSQLGPQTSAISLGRRLKSFSARHLLPQLPGHFDKMFDQQRGLGRRLFWQRSFKSVPVQGEWKFGVKFDTFTAIR